MPGDENKCGENFHGWHCCLGPGHSGEHLAHTGVGGHVMAIWGTNGGECVPDFVVPALGECYKAVDRAWKEHVGE